MADYPVKKYLGLTQKQGETLTKASDSRGQSETFLMREYIEAGASSDAEKGAQS